jgi:uncharacterized membrane protein
MQARIQKPWVGNAQAGFRVPHPPWHRSKTSDQAHDRSAFVNPIHLQFPAPSLTVSWVAFVVALVWAIRGIRWERLAECGFGRVWHGSIAVVVLLWSLQATLRDGFTFHLLGIVGIFLALGLHLAITSAALAILVVAIIQQAPLVNVAPTFFVLAVPALAVGRFTLWFCERHLPAHMFVYLFGAAFVGAGLSIAVTVPVSLLVWSILTQKAFATVLGDYLPIAIQLGFGEAVLTGMLLTIGVVYKPHWVATFDDCRYLARRD